jgi:pimeloyl-ACP methyl ester carboxylesterase
MLDITGLDRRKLLAVGCGTLLAGVLPFANYSSASVTTKKRHFVLVHGAWHGGWAWKTVAHQLRKLHTVSTPTLAGLGYRAHCYRQEFGLDVHVRDILDHLEMEDLNDVVLVGHSYGGMVIAGVLARDSSRIASAVFIDAFVPERGKSLADYTPPQMKSVYKQMLEDGKPAGPPPVETWGDRWGLTDLELRNWVADRVRPQSPLTFLEPVDGDPYGNDVRYTYIRCERNPNPLFENFAKQVQRDARWQCLGLDSHHEAMLLEPSRLVEMLAVVA